MSSNGSRVRLVSEGLGEGSHVRFLERGIEFSSDDGGTRFAGVLGNDHATVTVDGCQRYC